MTEETRKRIAKLYRDGKWNAKGKNDKEAEKLADKYYPKDEPQLKEEDKVEKPKRKKKVK